jgi:uncharacterized membrane-anchored protein YitT (DUF2179 family)
VPARISRDGDFAIYIADEGQLQKVKERLIVNTTAYCPIVFLINYCRHIDKTAFTEVMRPKAAQSREWK